MPPVLLPEGEISPKKPQTLSLKAEGSFPKATDVLQSAKPSAEGPAEAPQEAPTCGLDVLDAPLDEDGDGFLRSYHAAQRHPEVVAFPHRLRDGRPRLGLWFLRERAGRGLGPAPKKKNQKPSRLFTSSKAGPQK